jgi:hypothetical protein
VRIWTQYRLLIERHRLTPGRGADEGGDGALRLRAGHQRRHTVYNTDEAWLRRLSVERAQLYPHS